MGRQRSAGPRPVWWYILTEAANTASTPTAPYSTSMAACARRAAATNAQAESLWSRLKTEELGPREWPVFRDLADAQQSVATYFDYYNHERRYSALAY